MSILSRLPIAIIAAAEHAVGVFVRVAVYLLISWFGGPEVQGQFALFITVQTLAMTVGGLAFDVSNAVLAGKSASSRGQLWVNTLAVLSVSGLCSSLAIFVVARLNFIAQFDGMAVLLLGMTVFISTLGLGQGGILIGAYAFQWRAVAAIVGASVTAAIMSASVMSGGLDLNEVALIWTAGAVCSNGLLIAGALRICREPYGVNCRLLSSQFRIGMQSYTYFIGSNLTMRTSTFAVAYLLGAGKLGIFAIALAATEALLNLPRLFVPLMVGNAATGQGDIVRFLKTMHSALIVAVAVSAPALYFGLHRVLPSGYEGVSTIAVILLLGTVPFGLGTLAANYLLGSGHGAAASRAALLSGMFALVSLPVAIHLYSLPGAAGATALVQLLFASLSLRSLSRVKSVPLSSLVMPRIS